MKGGSTYVLIPTGGGCTLYGHESRTSVLIGGFLMPLVDNVDYPPPRLSTPSTTLVLIVLVLTVLVTYPPINSNTIQ